MCTISWGFEGDTLNILVNRDEQKARAHAELPRKFSENNMDYIMPIDPEGGGSWLAVNRQGLTLCILNRYQHAQAPANPRSRGLLIKCLAECSNWQMIDQLLQPAALAPYAPFSLLIFQPGQGPLMFRWDQRQVEQVIAPRSPVSSSAMFPRLTPWLRQRWARMTMPLNPSLAKMKHFHRSRMPFGQRLAVDMHRRHTQTVSVTHIALSPHRASLNYWQGQAKHIVHSPDANITLTLHGTEATCSFGSTINLKQLLTDFHPRLAQTLKPWQWRGFETLIAQKRLNQHLSQLNKMPASGLFDSALQRLGVEARVHALRWPEPSTRPVFVCNHPTGGIDGLLTIAILLKRFPNLQVLANDALLNIQQLREMVIPVGVFNQRQNTLHTLHMAFAGPHPLLVFPAGKTARKNASGVLEDGPWAKRIATLARQYQRCLVPMFIRSRNSAFFYRIHQYRQRLGIKTNIEMLLLPRETLRPAIKRPSVYVDVPLQPAEFEACASTDSGRMQWLKTRSSGLPIHFEEASGEQQRSSCSRSA